MGGGKVALRKIEKLLPFKPEITVAAPKICDEINKLPGLNITEKRFEDTDIDGAFVVISATDDNDLNAHIFRLCSERGILVNTVDDKEKCGFIFPALVKKENVTVGISTGGKSPIYARFLRKTIEGTLDDDCDEIIELLSSVRKTIKETIDTEEKRKEAFERILKFCITDRKSVDENKISEITEDLR